MDAAMAGLIGAAVGTGGTLGVGLLALIPPIKQEKAKVTKERNDALRDLLATYIDRNSAFCLRFEHRTRLENGEAALEITTLQSRIGLVLTKNDRPLIDFLALTLNTAFQWQEARLTVATTVGDVLPSWFRGEMTMKVVEKRRKTLEEFATLLKMKDEMTPA